MASAFSINFVEYLRGVFTQSDALRTCEVRLCQISAERSGAVCLLLSECVSTKQSEGLGEFRTPLIFITSSLSSPVKIIF